MFGPNKGRSWPNLFGPLQGNQIGTKQTKSDQIWTKQRHLGPKINIRGSWNQGRSGLNQKKDISVCLCSLGTQCKIDWSTNPCIINNYSILFVGQSIRLEVGVSVKEGPPLQEIGSGVTGQKGGLAGGDWWKVSQESVGNVIHDLFTK